MNPINDNLNETNLEIEIDAINTIDIECDQNEKQLETKEKQLETKEKQLEEKIEKLKLQIESMQNQINDFSNANKILMTELASIQKSVDSTNKSLLDIKSIDIEWLKSHYPILVSQIDTIKQLISIDNSTQKLIQNNAKMVKKSGTTVEDSSIEQSEITSKSPKSISAFFAQKMSENEVVIEKTGAKFMDIFVTQAVKNELKNKPHYMEQLVAAGTKSNEEYEKKYSSFVWKLLKEIESPKHKKLINLVEQSHVKYKNEFKEKQQIADDTQI